MTNISFPGERYRDKITLDDKVDQYSVYITITGDAKHDFNIKLEFRNLNSQALKKLAEYTKLSRAIKINSEYIAEKELPITHLVIEKFTADSLMNMEWRCVSDDPNMSLEL